MKNVIQHAQQVHFRLDDVAFHDALVKADSSDSEWTGAVRLTSDLFAEIHEFPENAEVDFRFERKENKVLA